ncbi:MAG: GGDEF domain-containing response regulator [Alcaligenaceae bacterium]|nr:GGDEF domain-containing response regulator [Alcaligenaceae bacterium SAGV5]MPS55066.1 GGDEF domain-containing response regulator [Alcaligenaceae bacterium SAGV3]MPT58072.1 GGDEF domain-containing response regulator [Alcaligenaceae bacterium]
MRKLLAQIDAELITVTSGNEALALCLDQRFALILLDVNMPEMDGYEVAALLANEPLNRDTPVIFVTAAYADDLNQLKGYRSGAVDYIAKPVNDSILLSKVKVFLELETGRQQLAQALAELGQRNQQLQVEITERRRIEEQMRHQATHDQLTGLPNRALFTETLDRFLSRAQRHDELFALLYVDIDGFKQVNDGHGHQAGDMLLQAFSQRLRSALRAEDVVARLGGDEFGVLLCKAADAAAIQQKCVDLCEILRAPYRLTSNGAAFTAHVGASIGAAIAMHHGTSRDSLVQAADNAMYEAKRSGKNQSRLAASQL